MLLVVVREFFLLAVSVCAAGLLALHTFILRLVQSRAFPMLSAKGQVLTKFSEEDDDSLYLRDVVRLIATERRQKRLGAIWRQTYVMMI